MIPRPTISALPPACSPCLLPVIKLALLDGDVSSVSQLSWPITKSLLLAKRFFSFFPLPDIRTIPFLADLPIPYSLRVSIILSLNAFRIGVIMISTLEWNWS